MAINFDKLPQDNPYALPAPNVYRAKIVEAEMKAPKNDPTKPDYLNIKLALFDRTNKSCGSIYDIISESDSSVVQYKVSRFIRACGIPLTGSMELKDIAKIIKGKEIAVDIRHAVPRKGDEANFKPKAEVDLFTREAYYLPTEFEEIYFIVHPDEAEEEDFANNNAAVGDDEERPFDAPDGGAPAGHPEY
jgi:hypothetical protein